MEAIFFFIVIIALTVAVLRLVHGTKVYPTSRIRISEVKKYNGKEYYQIQKQFLHILWWINATDNDDSDAIDLRFKTLKEATKYYNKHYKIIEKKRGKKIESVIPVEPEKKIIKLRKEKKVKKVEAVKDSPVKQYITKSTNIPGKV
jgi:hypothetical protein